MPKSKSPRRAWVLAAVLATGCHARGPLGLPAAETPDDGWGDGVAAGIYDSCPALRVAAGPPARSRDARAIACGAWCRAHTVQVVASGNAATPELLRPVLDRVGLRLVDHGADVTLRIRLDSQRTERSWMPSCNPIAGCTQPSLQIESTLATQGAFEMLEREGEVVARATLDGKQTSTNAQVELSEVSGLWTKLVRALAEHRGGATFGLITATDTPYLIGFRGGPALFAAPNDWSVDPVARAQLPALLEAARRTQSPGYLGLVDPDWGCAPELAPQISRLADLVRAGDRDARGLAMYIPDPRITDAFVAVAASQRTQGIEGGVIAALRRRGGRAVDAVLADAVVHVMGPASSDVDRSLQLWLALKTHGDGRGDRATIEGALHHFATEPQIRATIAALEPSRDPRASLVIGLPLVIGKTSPELEQLVVETLARRGGINAALVLSMWATRREPLPYLKAHVTSAIERAREQPLPDVTRVIVQAEELARRNPGGGQTALELLLLRVKDPAIDRALEALFTPAEPSPAYSWALCLGVRRGSPAAQARAAGTDELRRCAP